ncbi:MAG: hypothetical protein LBP70_01620 [Mycoplasmataceae bacterium]|nr:hypothetical protein [Mycoplasmataceae bacterium]
MKSTENITIAEIQQKLEVIEIQLKLLFESYKNFIGRYLTWCDDDPQHKDNEIKNKLRIEFQDILQSMDTYSVEMAKYIRSTNVLLKKVKQTNSVSLMRSVERNLLQIDETLIRINTYIFLIDESRSIFMKIFANVKTDAKKRILN